MDLFFEDLLIPELISQCNNYNGLAALFFIFNAACENKYR